MTKADTALKTIPTPGNGERDQWITITAAYKAAGGSFDVWDAWSQRGGGYSQRDAKDVWNSLKPGGGITEKTLYKLAIDNGWKDPEKEQRAGSQPMQQPKPQQMPRPPQVAQPNPPRPGKIRAEIENALYDEKQAGIARAYCKARGFTDATIDRFNIGYNPSFKLAGTDEPRAIIPYPGEEYYTARRLSAAGDTDGKKYLYPPKVIAGGKRAFNVPALTGGAEIVYITEGQLDAISIEQAGGAAVGCNEPSQMLDALKKAGDKVTAKYFIIVPDRDENGAGADKAWKMWNRLNDEKLAVFTQELPDGVHDANDGLKRPGLLQSWIASTPKIIEAEKAKAQEAQEKANEAQRQEFNEQTGAGRLAAFADEIRNSINKQATPTGFNQLDRKLEGGLWPGLYIIGAISSLGKTTFGLQIVDQIARETGRGCLVFSLEMAAFELMAKSISRITDSLASQEREKKTMRGITAGGRYLNYSETEKALIKAAFDEYGTFAGNIVIIEGQGDIGVEQIRETVHKYTAAHAGKAPIILVDYLQILAPADPRATDKQNADRAVTELKRISRDYKTPVIAISSFNRDNYSTVANMAAFKESGAIEYSSDVLLALQLEGVGVRENGKSFDVDIAKQAIPRKVELCILKNRNGQTGAKIPFEYDARFNAFREQGVSDDDIATLTGGKAKRML